MASTLMLSPPCTYTLALGFGRGLRVTLPVGFPAVPSPLISGNRCMMSRDYHSHGKCCGRRDAALP